MSQCEYIKEDGDQCGAYAVGRGRFCISHSNDPKIMDIKAKAVRNRGKSVIDGLASWEERPLETVQDVQELLSDALNAAMLGKISNGRANAISSLGNTLIKAIELNQLAEEMKDLQRIVKEMSR